MTTTPHPAISEALEIACTSCSGTGWVDDQNWSPPYDDIPQDREPGNGKIQCWTCVGTGTIERDQSDVISELKTRAESQAVEIERLKAELDAEKDQVGRYMREAAFYLKERDSLTAQVAGIMKCISDRKAIYQAKKDAADPLVDDTLTHWESLDDRITAFEYLEASIAAQWSSRNALEEG